jgi:SRSO17 transposase
MCHAIASFFIMQRQKENGIVAVTAYGLVEGMIIPLSFEVYKPQERLKPSDEY